MERIVCGNVILYREECPFCGEFNLSSNDKFTCLCGGTYFNNDINSTRIVCTKDRENLRKHLPYLTGLQGNRCYWCNREIGEKYLKKIKGKKKYKIIKLGSHIDHIIPYSYCKNNGIENLCLSCSVCNLWKSNKIFTEADKCKLYLNYKWDKLLNREILIKIITK